MASCTQVLGSGIALPARRTASVTVRSSFAGSPVLFRSYTKAARTSKKQIVRATRSDLEEETSGQVDVDAYVKDLQARWDRVENKPSVAIYGVGAVVLLWLSSTIVSAVNAVPVLPKLLELVGLGYTAWFVYRYLLFKSSREELLQDVEELKKKISGATDVDPPKLDRM